jgi:hypothetical protein
MKKLIMTLIALSLTIPMAAQNPPAIAAYISSNGGASWAPLTGGSGTPASQPPPSSAIYASCNTNQWCPWNGTGGGGGGDTITSPNSTLSIGGTSSATTLDVNPATNLALTTNQTITSAQGSGDTLTLTNTNSTNTAAITIITAGSPGGWKIFAGGTAVATGELVFYNPNTGDSPLALYPTSVTIANGVPLQWTNGTSYGGAPQTGISQTGAAQLAAGNGTQGDASATFDAAIHSSGVATVATATTIAPTVSHVNLTGTTAIATITTPTGLSSTVGACLTFYPASTVATTTAGNIEAVYSLVGGKAYQGCWNGTKWWFIGSGI